jgi:hypothetical protein
VLLWTSAWLLLCSRPLYAQAEFRPGLLLLSEVHAAPHAVKDIEGEWIEIANPGTATVDLYGWRLVTGDGREEVIALSLPVPPGGYLLLAHQGDPTRNGGVDPAYLYTQLELGNQTETLTLFAPDGVQVDQVAWDVAQGTHPVEGASLERTALDPAAPWLPAHSPWPGSAGDFGSPGLPYRPPPTATPLPTAPPAIPPRLRLSEFMADPVAVSDEAGEWVELYNDDRVPILLDGWVLADSDNDHALLGGGVWLQPGTYAVVARNPDAGQNGGVVAATDWQGLQLANEQDELLLITPWGVMVDQVQWGEGRAQVRAGASLERTAWDGDNWVTALVPWPRSWGDLGSPNAPYVVPPTPTPTATASATPTASPTTTPSATLPPVATPTATPAATPLPLLWPARTEASPLVIDQLFADGSEGEFVVLVNIGDHALRLAGWRIGDAEVPGDREGLLQLPAEVELAPGERWMLARSGDAFQARWGIAPQAEWSATDAAWLRLQPEPGWAAGDMALADDGDEVILLDPEGRLADVAAWNNSESGALGVHGRLQVGPGQALVRAPDAPYPGVIDLRHRFLLLPPAPQRAFVIPSPLPVAPQPLAGGMVALWGSLGAVSTFTPGGNAPPHLLWAAAAAQGLDFLAVADLARAPTDFVGTSPSNWPTLLPAWRWQAPDSTATTVVYSPIRRAVTTWEEFHTYLTLHEALAQCPPAAAAVPAHLAAYMPVVDAEGITAPGGLVELQRLWQQLAVPLLPGGNSPPPLPGSVPIGPHYTGLVAQGRDLGAIMAALRARRGWLTSAPGLWLTLRADDSTWMGASLPPANAVTLQIAYGDRSGDVAGLALWQDGELVRQLDQPPADGQWTVTLPAVPGRMLYAVATQLDGDFAVTAPLYVQPLAGGNVLLNEVLPAPAADHNGDGTINTDDEYIELYNPGSATLGLAGYTLGDASTPAGGHRFRFGADQMIGAGERLLLWQRTTGLNLNDAGDLVQLVAPDGSVVDTVIWNARDRGPSLSRLPDGGAWQEQGLPTPGAPNRALPPPAPAPPAPPPNPDPPPVDPTDVGDPASPNFGQAPGPPGSLALAKLRGLDAQVEFRAQVVVPPGLFPSAIYVAEPALDAGGLPLPIAGLGVMVYLTQGDFLPLREGDWVLVRGVVKSFRGEMEIRVDEPGQVWPIGPATPLQPLRVAPGQIVEAVEGRLVTVEGVITGWQGDSLYLGDPHDPAVLPVRVTVRSSLGWKRPYVHKGERYVVVGVVSQFAREAPWNGGYRLLVRYAADVQQLAP